MDSGRWGHTRQLGPTESWGGVIGEAGVTTVTDGSFALWEHGAVISMVALISIAVMMARDGRAL